jgi:iron complex outermembrane receptor protein
MVMLASLFSALLASEAAPSVPATNTVVVVTASRIGQDSFGIPAAISVVDMANAGESQPNVNVSEALARVPGLLVQNRQNYAQDLQISSRGFGARAAFGVRGVRLLVDGIPATLPDGQGQAATFNLDMAERIEVLRGPFSAIYGNHAGGVIQLFTRDGAGPSSVALNVSAGSDGMRKSDVNAQGSAGAINYVVDASRFETDGYRAHSAATREQAFAKVSMELQAGAKLTVQASALRQPGSQDPLGVLWATWQRDPRAGEIDTTDTANPKRTFAERYDTRKDITHQQLGFAWDQRWGEGQLHLAAYGGNRRVIQFQSFSKAFQAPASHSGGVVDFDRSFEGIDLHWTQAAKLADATLNVTIGVDYARANDARLGFENFVGTVFGVKGQLRRDEQDRQEGIDPYLQAEWLQGPWQVSAGLRHSRLNLSVDDHFKSNGNDSGNLSYVHSTPVLGLLYKLHPSLNLYASAAGGFEAPTMNEMFYSSSGGFNFKLAAARSTHIEAGLKAKEGNVRLNAALFQVNTRDELVVDSAIGGRTSYRNASRTLRQGAELSIEGRAGEDWSAQLAATLLRAVYTQGFGAVLAGSRIPGVPNANLFAELAWKPRTSAIGATLEVQANGRAYADDTNADIPAPGYALVNASINAQFVVGKWQLKQFIRFNNVADRRYVGSVIVGDANKRYYEAAPGRNLLFGAKAQYQF